MADAIKQNGNNALERVTGAHAVITTDHAFIHEGIAYTAAGKMDVLTTKTGGLFIKPPVATAATVTIDMTNANADLTYTAVGTGSETNSVNVTHVDPEAVSAELAVSVFVKTIIVSLATDENGDIISTAAEVKAAVNAHAEAALLASCDDEGDGSGVVEAVANTFLAGAVDSAYIHFKAAAIRSTAAVTVSLLEGYVKDPGDTVGAVTPRNRKRTAADASVVTLTGGTDVTPTHETTYCTLATAAIGANLPAYKVGGDVSSAEEWVLQPGVSYCLAIANASGSTATVSYDLFWYEEAGA